MYEKKSLDLSLKKVHANSAQNHSVKRSERKQMKQEILGKMKKGVYYPGNHLGKRNELEDLVAEGFLERMDGSFFCGPDNEPSYCLTDEGCHQKHKTKG